MIASDRLSFQRQIYDFLRTVTIKYTPIAEYINSNLLERGLYVNDQDPTSWKYYKNMMGEYHSSDTLMYVNSVDTQVQILFSKENLNLHPRTRSLYVPGGQYHDRLCDLYPNQVDLIKSILFPVDDLTKAITSEDLTILSYGSGYLESYEENPLIEGLRAFLEIIKERWYFEFLDDEPYFHITFFGGLWTKMAGFLLTEREYFIHTPYVHSWHIWNHLRDAGLDDYSDILNREKSIMLYQNIGYFKANAGKMSNLIILVNRLLDDFGVSIYARRVVQESETGAEDYQLTPQLQAIRIPTNNQSSVTEIGDETVETIQNRAFAKGFVVDNSSEAAVAKERRLSDTTINNFMTKFLEIRPIARNKIYSDIINVFLLETLSTTILHDYYKDPVVVNDPATNSILYLYPRELLALYHYASIKSLGRTPEMIPNGFFFNKAFNTEIATPTKTIKIDNEKIYLSMYVNTQSFLSDLHYDTVIEDPAAFSQMVSRLWLRYLEHLLEDTSSSVDTKRHVLNYLSSLCHTRRIEEHVLIEGHDSYKRWLGPEGIDIQSSILGQYDIQADPALAWSNLSDTIISALIPMTDTLTQFGNYTLTDFGYERLRQLFIQMCSYKVVFLESTRDTPNFITGAKWSHRYGPDEFASFSDYTIVNKMNLNDHTVLSQDIPLYPGYLEQTKDTTVIVGKLEGHLESTIVSNHVDSAGDYTTPGVKYLAAQSNIATLHIPCTGMTIVGIETDSSDAGLIDIDNTRLIDDDGSYLVDPNT
jgi:hypothetical protein